MVITSRDFLWRGARCGRGDECQRKRRSTLIERKHLIDVMGTGLPPENFDLGGISGGPMLTVIENRGMRCWQLAGVIYEGPNTSEDPDTAIAGLEIIRARRADFLLPDGTLDESRWKAQMLLRGR